MVSPRRVRAALIDILQVARLGPLSTVLLEALRQRQERTKLADILARAFPVCTPVRFVVFAWIAIVIQGSIDSIEGVSTGNACSPVSRFSGRPGRRTPLGAAPVPPAGSAPPPSPVAGAPPKSQRGERGNPPPLPTESPRLILCITASLPHCLAASLPLSLSLSLTCIADRLHGSMSFGCDRYLATISS